MVGGERRPISAEMKLSVGMAEPVEEMRSLERQAAIKPAIIRKVFNARQPACPQSAIDKLDWAQLKARMTGAEAMGESADHVVVRTAFSVGRKDCAADLEIGMGAGSVEIIVLEKGRRRQHDVGHCCSFGHELLVDADEQVIAGEALSNQTRFRGDDHRVGILDEQRGDWWPVAEIALIAGQHWADPRLVEDAGCRIENIEPLDQGACRLRKNKMVAKVNPSAALEPH